MAREFGLGGLFVPDAASLPEVDEDRKLRLGMLLYVLADVFLAIFFFGTWIFLRGYNTNGRWFPPGAHAPDLLQNTWIMVIAVAGGIAYAIGAWGLGRSNQSLFRYAMLAATFLYLVDGAGQIWLMTRQPFDLSSGSFASAFVLLAGYHAYHMLLGTFLGIGVTNRAFRGYYAVPVVATGTTPNVSRGVTHGAVVGHEEAAASDVTAPEEVPQSPMTGIAAIGYYWYWAAFYAILFWLLLLIQPAAYHPF